MAQTDYYEEIRQKLRLGPIATPKHEKIIEFLKLIWDENDVKLLNHMPGVGALISPIKLAKQMGVDKSVVKQTLNKLADKGTILRLANQFGLLPLAPGMVELYFLTLKDSEDNLKKSAEIFRDIIDIVLPPMFLAAKLDLFRPKLPYDAKERLIQVDEELEAGSIVLPYEQVEQLIERNDYFVSLPCQCRLIGELAGDPCEHTKSGELGCLACGIVAQQLTSMGIGKKISKEEAIEHIKKAEKSGLVHNGANSMGMETHLLICNCCSCHCGLLSPVVKYRLPGTAKSNYEPRINHDSCINCETCLRNCPTNAIFHQWPIEADSSDEKMIIKYDDCIGCGVCAANCPKDAILLKKVRNENPPKTFPFDINIFGR